MKYDLIISCGLLAFGCAIASYFHCNRARLVTVAVKGVAEKIVASDHCKLKILATNKAASIEELYKQRKYTKGKILALLKHNSIEDREVKDDSYIYFYDAIYNATTGTLEREAYYADNTTFTIDTDKIKNIDNICKAQDELLKDNIVASFSVDYKIKNFYDLKTQLVKEATKNAADTANEILNQVNERLGELQSISQGSIAILPEDEIEEYNNSSKCLNKKLRLVVQAVFKKK